MRWHNSASSVDRSFGFEMCLPQRLQLIAVAGSNCCFLPAPGGASSGGNGMLLERGAEAGSLCFVAFGSEGCIDLFALSRYVKSIPFPKSQSDQKSHQEFIAAYPVVFMPGFSEDCA